MVKFSVVSLGENMRDMAYAMKELKNENLIAATEKDQYNDTVYMTHNIVAVKKIIEDYDGLMVDIHKE